MTTPQRLVALEAQLETIRTQRDADTAARDAIVAELAKDNASLAQAQQQLASSTAAFKQVVQQIKDELDAES